LTGLFGIPLAIPLVLGVLFKKTNSVGAFFSVIAGIFSGLIFTIFSTVSWELGTFLQMVIVITVFFTSGYIFKSKESYKKQVSEFFVKVETPLRTDEIGKTDPAFQRALTNLFSIIIAASGLLFCGMSLNSINQNSGEVGMIIGIICIILAVILKRVFTGTFKFKQRI
jgi:Na+/proline symporter